jgi:hypothetical protein
VRQRICREGIAAAFGPPHFFMRKTIAAASSVLVALVLTACSSSSGAGNTYVKPLIQLVQTSNVPVAARHTDGPLTIHYAMRVENRAGEPLTLQQVTVQSVSEGAYYVAPTSKPYDIAIAPGAKEDVEFWVSAQPAGSIVGANGPVTLRVTCIFDSPAGKFQQIVMQRVNENASITGE